MVACVVRPSGRDWEASWMGGMGVGVGVGVDKERTCGEQIRT